MKKNFNHNKNNQNKNFYQIFEEQLKEIEGWDKKPRLLLHACCCPCSSHCLEILHKYFDITVYFYNPNIDELEEYKKRINELERFVTEAPFAIGVQIEEGEYEPEVFYEMAKGREHLPERGERCYDCYKLRLEKSARYALEHGYDFFTTTLSISPYKNAEWINEIGADLEDEMRAEINESDPDNKCIDESSVPIYLYSDFKKKNGYKRSIELSKEYNLYRQDYCGCAFSRRDKISSMENS